MKELAIHHVRATPYHPELQGALERFHQTLKTMIRAYCNEHRSDWEQGVPLLLFAMRSARQESLGYSPFELVYGHEVKGPLQLLKGQLMDPSVEDMAAETAPQFKARLATVGRLARENLERAQERMKENFDRKAEDRAFKPGDKVLVRTQRAGGTLGAQYDGAIRRK